MIPAEHFEYAKKNIPEFGGDETVFLESLLCHGLTLPIADNPAPAYHIPGRVIADLGPIDSPRGPYGRSCKFMFVAVAPDFQDYTCGGHFAAQGPSKLLCDGLKNAGFNLAECYFTTVMRFPRPLNSSSYKQCWLRQGWEYFLEEYSILRPDVVCFLGSEALKMAQGNKASLEDVRGQMFTFEGGHWTSLAMAIPSHMGFVANTAGFPAFVKQLIMVKDLLNPDRAKILTGTEYPDRDYKILWTPEEIIKAVEEELAAGTHTIAIDVETATDTGRPDHAYLISFQWSSRPGHARLIPFLVERPEPMLSTVVKAEKNADGVVEPERTVEMPMYGGCGVDRKSIQDRVPHWDVIKDQVVKLLDGVSRLAGHNLRYDLIGVRDEFDIEVRKYITRGIFDTMQAYHALEKDEYGLKQLTLRFTDMGAYDAPMYNWISQNTGKGKLFTGGKEDRFFHGFRDICFKYLLPYGMCDTDATIRLVPILEERLNAPGLEQLKDLFYGTLLPLNSAIIDIETRGLPVDQERAEKLAHLYRKKYDELLDNFRILIDAPDFNVNSPHQVPALLYGGVYKNYKKCQESIPKDAYRCNLTPPWETGKYGNNWEDLDPLELQFHSPSCEAKALKKLLTSVPNLDPKSRTVLERLCEIKDMKQFVTMFLAAPNTEEPASADHPRYGKGLLGCILDSGRMRTQISLLSETHRWKHRSPNLANLPKAREESIQAIFAAHVEEGDEEAVLDIDDGALEVKDGHNIIHIPKIRSIFVARPGWRLIEADYKSAELWVMGMLSGDAHFCHVLANEPDMHLHNAIQIFKLDTMGLDIHDSDGYAKIKKKYKNQRFAVKAVCLAEGTPVLTELRGFVPIEQVRMTDRVWDGVEWVAHDGLLDKGVQEVIEVNGVWMTPDHKVLTNEGMVEAWKATRMECRLSARPLGDGRLLTLSAGHEVGCDGSEFDVPVATKGSTSPQIPVPSSPERGVRVRCAGMTGLEGLLRLCTGTTVLCQTLYRGGAGSTVSPQPWLAVTTLVMLAIAATAVEAFLSATSGGLTTAGSCCIFSLCLAGITLALLWSVQTTIRGTNLGISRVSHSGSSAATGGIPGGLSTAGGGFASQTSGRSTAPGSKTGPVSATDSPLGGHPQSLLLARTSPGERIARVYDLHNAGPRHRFQVGQMIVKNCFGLAYGLGASGLSDQLSLEFKRFVGTDEAQKIIDGYFEQYPGLRKFFDACKVQVAQNGYIQTPFGSRRYFPGFDKVGRDKQAKMQREGGNALIQGSVAIMLDKASVLLDQVRYDTDIGNQIGWEYLLAIHDAMYVHTPEWAVDTTSEIVKWAMESIMIPGINKGLQVDSDHMDRWGSA